MECRSYIYITADLSERTEVEFMEVKQTETVIKAKIQKGENERFRVHLCGFYIETNR